MVLILGHRGLKGKIENTLPAFRRALKYADGIELDVWRTLDGKIIVSHNGHIDGTRVGNLTLRDVKLRTGNVLTLKRVLGEFRESFFNIDIKDVDAVEDSIKLAEEFKVEAVFSSDRTDVVQSLLRECPNCRVGFSITRYSSLLALPSFRDIYSLHVPMDTVSYVGFRNVVSLMKFFRKRGLKLFLWNYEMEELVWVPKFIPFIDAVISDDPARLRKALLARGLHTEKGEHHGGLE